MTATRLREIAFRVEQVCVEFRKAMSGVTIPCDACHRAAEDLRELATEMGPPVFGERTNAAAHFRAGTARIDEANDKKPSDPFVDFRS